MDDNAAADPSRAEWLARLRGCAPHGVWDLESVERLATRLHEGQVDKSGAAYIAHPARVAAQLSAAGRSDTVVAAGWLHDAVEDTAVTTADLLEIGLDADVVELVEVLTHQRHEPRAAYYAHIAEHPDAVVVKLADIDDNADPVRLAALDDATRARLVVKYDKARRALGAR